MYKNSCTQDAGFNASVGQWMAQEAVKRKIGPEGREGGIILDSRTCMYDSRTCMYVNRDTLVWKP